MKQRLVASMICSECGMRSDPEKTRHSLDCSKTISKDINNTLDEILGSLLKAHKEPIQALVKECLPERVPIYGSELGDHENAGYNRAIEEITKNFKQKGLL